MSIINLELQEALRKIYDAREDVQNRAFRSDISGHLRDDLLAYDNGLSHAYQIVLNIMRNGIKDVSNE